MILSHLWSTESVWVLLVQFTYRVIQFVSTHLKLVHEGLIWFSRRTDSCGSVYIQGDSACEWFKAPPSYTPYTAVSKPETSTAPPPHESPMCKTCSNLGPQLFESNASLWAVEACVTWEIVMFYWFSLNDLSWSVKEQVAHVLIAQRGEHNH